MLELLDMIVGAWIFIVQADTKPRLRPGLDPHRDSHMGPQYVVNRALKGVARVHKAAGTKPRVRLPITWETILCGQTLVPSWGPGGRVLWLCLALSYFLLARSEEMFASSAAGIHPIHCLQRQDMTFYDVEGKELSSIQWRRATRAEVTFRGHEDDQAQQGSAVIRMRDIAYGTRSQIGAGGGAVALLVELMSCHIALPGSAPLCSYRQAGIGTVVLGYRRALKALRHIVELAGDDPKQFGLHSLRIGGATATAAGGQTPDRVVEREGRWKRKSGLAKKSR